MVWPIVSVNQIESIHQCAYNHAVLAAVKLPMQADRPNVHPK